MRSVLAVTALLALGCATAEPQTVPRSVEIRGRGFADRSIIRTASIRVEVSDVESATRDVAEAARQAGGYVEGSQIGEDSQARLTLRVPTANLDPLLDRVGLLGKEKARATSARDVTEEVADLGAALENNRAFRDRLRALLERTETVEEVLKVETELNRLQTEIDRQEGRLARLKSQVSMAAVHVRIDRQRLLGPLGYVLSAPSGSSPSSSSSTRRGVRHF